MKVVMTHFCHEKYISSQKKSVTFIILLNIFYLKIQIKHRESKAIFIYISYTFFSIDNIAASEFISIKSYYGGKLCFDKFF